MKTRRHKALFETNSEGKLQVYNRKLLDNFFKQHPGSRFEVDIKKIAKNKSSQLRAYYFAEVVQKFMIIFRGHGYNFNSNTCHDFIKKLSPVMIETVEMNGRHFERVRSFTDDDFTNEDMQNYIEDLKQIGAQEFGILINDPRE